MNLATASVPSVPWVPSVGDRLISPDGKLTLTVTGVGALITWRVDRGGEKPLHFNASPSEFAYRMALSAEAGATFSPAQHGDPEPVEGLPSPSASSAPSAENSDPQPCNNTSHATAARSQKRASTSASSP